MTTSTIKTGIGDIPSPSNWAYNTEMYQTVGIDATILPIEKQDSGKVTLEDISGALDEYKRLFKAGIASKAELVTLSRAYPDDLTYSKAISKLSEGDAMVLGGPASVELIDREGHLITTQALEKAFTKYMDNFRTRNTMVLHCLVPGTKVLKVKIGYVPIETLQVGDKVITHTGKSRKILKTIEHQSHGKIMHLTLENGEFIQITDEHPVLTKTGWKKAGVLTTDDILMTASSSSITYWDKVEKGYVHHATRNGVVNKGKTIEEMVGVERADHMRQVMKENGRKVGVSGKGAAITAEQRKGKTWKEVYGHERPQYQDMSGSNNSNWQGGMDRNGYPYVFNSTLKWHIRKLDNYTCQLCGKTQEQEYQELDRPLSIHHIDYNKQNCGEDNLVTTCCSCNSKANYNRQSYIDICKGVVSHRQVATIHNGTNILKVEESFYSGPVYNFEVEEDNSYAGKGIIYHNSDVQVGWALPAYISKGGQIFKAGVGENGLFFITELRDDTKIAQRVMDQVNEGKLKSYSIAGSATKTQNMEKGLQPYMQVDEMELAEVTVCEKGVNQNAVFDILKAEGAVSTCIDGSCLMQKQECNGSCLLSKAEGQVTQVESGYREATDVEKQNGIMCGTCKFFNKEEQTCDIVEGMIADHMYCKLFSPTDASPTIDEGREFTMLMEKSDGSIDFTGSFLQWVEKQVKPSPSKDMAATFATLLNTAGRVSEHHQLLREYGFPSEQPPEAMRYTPVIETETDDFGIPVHMKPPWIVNEAGSHLGTKLDADAPTYDTSLAAKAHKAMQSTMHPWYSTEIKVAFPVRKSFSKWFHDNEFYL